MLRLRDRRVKFIYDRKVKNLYFSIPVDVVSYKGYVKT
jgi:hypothetical protein